MTKYTYENFLKTFKLKLEYSPGDGNNPSFQYRKRCDLFVKYFKSFLIQAYRNDLRITCKNRSELESRPIRHFRFVDGEFSVKFIIEGDIEFISANNIFGIAPEVFITQMKIVVERIPSPRMLTLSTTYSILTIARNKDNKTFQKVLKEIKKFCKKDDQRNAWLLLQGINVEALKDA